MRFTTFLNLLPLAAFTAQAASNAPAGCKVIPGDANWPAEAIWKSELKQAEVQPQVGKYKHATYRLDATKPEHVVAGVNFARKYNIRLSILNSGHDFDGRNDAPTGLVIVTRDLKGARILSSFTASEKGAESVTSKTKINTLPVQKDQAYLTIGSGYNIQEVTSLLAPSSLFALGAAHKSVSIAGGWGQTAGHAPLATKYGLGADQFVEFKVVTPDGKLRVANAASNPDLFWALRGGGGGTFGVVTEATIKVYPTPKVSYSSFYVNTTAYSDKKSIWPAAAYLHARFPEFADKGMTAYYYLYENGFSLFTTMSGEKEGRKTWMDNEWYPVLQKVAAMPGMSKSFTYVSQEYPDYASYFRAQYGSMFMKRSDGTEVEVDSDGSAIDTMRLDRRHGPGEGGETQSRGIMADYSDSWFLGEQHCKSPKLAEALRLGFPRMVEGEYRGQMVGGGKIHELGNDTAVLPAWRKVYVHTIAVGHGYPNVTSLRQLAPDMGAYNNEAGRFTPNWRKSFYGDNYERLSAIKSKYDPEGLLWISPGINADAFTATKEGRVCRAQTAIRMLDHPGESAPASDNLDVLSMGEGDETLGPRFPMYFTGPLSGRSVKFAWRH